MSDQTFISDAINSEPAKRRLTKTRSHTRLQKLKDEFLSLAAHEIRTPITVIKAQAQLAEKFYSQGKLHGELLEKSLKTFVDESDRLARLCSDLLDIVRIDNESFEMNRSHFDVSKLSTEVVQRARSKCKNEIVLEAKSSLVVHADCDRTRQVLDSLITNAVRYSPEGAKIFVRTYSADAVICISVRDEGIGIPEDQLSGIFERYSRAHQAGLKGPCGLGIGLYLCREIVRRMNGSIRAISKGLGHGAEFVFTLPLENNIGDDSMWSKK